MPGETLLGEIATKEGDRDPPDLRGGGLRQEFTPELRAQEERLRAEVERQRKS